MNPLKNWIAPLVRRLRGMVGRCVLQAVDDGKGLQEAQALIMEGTTRSGLERLQNYGFTSYPLPGAEGVALFPGGDQDHGVLIAVDDRRYRVQISEGEVCIYDNLGQTIKLRQNGQIAVNATTEVALVAPKTIVDGELEVRGISTFKADVGVEADLSAEEVTGTNAALNITGIKNIYNAHTHPGGGVPAPQL